MRRGARPAAPLGCRQTRVMRTWLAEPRLTAAMHRGFPPAAAGVRNRLPVFDRVDEGLHDLRQFERLLRWSALPRRRSLCRRYQPTRGGEIGGAPDRRQRKADGAPAARRDADAIEGRASARGRRRRRRDRWRANWVSAIGLPVEQRLSGERRLVAAAGRAAPARIAGPALVERPPARPAAGRARGRGISVMHTSTTARGGRLPLLLWARG